MSKKEKAKNSYPIGTENNESVSKKNNFYNETNAQNASKRNNSYSDIKE